MNEYHVQYVCTQLFAVLDFILLSRGSRNSYSHRALEIVGFHGTRPHCNTKGKCARTAISVKPLPITCHRAGWKGEEKDLTVIKRPCK